MQMVLRRECVYVWVLDLHMEHRLTHPINCLGLPNGFFFTVNVRRVRGEFDDRL